MYIYITLICVLLAFDSTTQSVLSISDTILLLEAVFQISDLMQFFLTITLLP